MLSHGRKQNILQNLAPSQPFSRKIWPNSAAYLQPNLDQILSYAEENRPVGNTGILLLLSITPPPPMGILSHLRTQSTDQRIREVAVQWLRSPRSPTPCLACRLGGEGGGRVLTKNKLKLIIIIIIIIIIHNLFQYNTIH
jgi:hypothetical protein